MVKRVNKNEKGNSRVDANTNIKNKKDFKKKHRKHEFKKKIRNKGLEVSYDRDALRDFVTGFEKRKRERREHAKKKIEEKEKLAKKIQRAKINTELKARLGLKKDDKWVDSSSENEEPEEVEKKVYASTEGGETIVTVKEFELFSDDEKEKEKIKEKILGLKNNKEIKKEEKQRLPQRKSKKNKY